MTHSLIQLLHEKIAHGLKRNVLRNPAQWACQYRMMGNPYPGPWSFVHHPWLKEMHNSQADFNIGMKAAQMGFTEWALNMTFYNIDVLSNDCLYILPGEGDAGDFSAGRFDPALEASTHLRNMFHNVRNVGHKRAGHANLYIRGSRSRSKLKSIPTGFIVFDEVDEMTQDNIPLAMERASGQLTRQILMISTPTVEKDDYGIFGHYNGSTMEHFFFPCPSCGRRIELLPENLVIGSPVNKSYYHCLLCKGALRHEEKPNFLGHGSFVPTISADKRGFTVNQLYSSAKAGRPEEIATAIIEAENDPAKEQELYNSKFALPHTVAGARLSETEIDKCIKGYAYPATRNDGTIVTMGVDVGRLLYVVVKEFKVIERGNDISDVTQARIIDLATPTDFSDLDKLMRKYSVNSCVVDRHPETRSAYQFATRFWGKVLLCMYGRGLSGRQVSIGSESEKTVTVDRTSWLDCTYQRIYNQRVEYPKNLPNEYRVHLRNMVRHYDKDKFGNPVVRYVNIGPDHFAHADNYAEIALPFAVGEGHQTITKVT